MRVSISDWHPTPLNKLLNSHWGTASKMKKSDREIIAWAFQGFPKAAGKRSVELEIVLAKGQRGCDPDSYYKSALDSLVHAGMLTDDNRQGVEIKPVKFSRALRKSTIITLMDI